MFTRSRKPTSRQKVTSPTEREPVHAAGESRQMPLWARFKPVQTKSLRINHPNGPDEREADRVADRVMRMPEALVQRQPEEEEEEELLQPKRLPAGDDFRVQRQVEEEEELLQPKRLPAGGNFRVQRQVEEEEGEEEELLLPRRAPSAGTPAAAPPSVNAALRSPGQPLDACTRRFMEPRFGRDFGDVRVHTNAAAAQSATDVNGKAYTVGTDIVFGSGQYSPASTEGRRLLAHELTHVLQQRGNKPIMLQKRPRSESTTLTNQSANSPVAETASQTRSASGFWSGFTSGLNTAGLGPSAEQLASKLSGPKNAGFCTAGLIAGVFEGIGNSLIDNIVGLLKLVKLLLWDGPAVLLKAAIWTGGKLPQFAQAAYNFFVTLSVVEKMKFIRAAMAELSVLKTQIAQELKKVLNMAFLNSLSSDIGQAIGGYFHAKTKQVFAQSPFFVGRSIGKFVGYLVAEIVLMFTGIGIVAKLSKVPIVTRLGKAMAASRAKFSALLAKIRGSGTIRRVANTIIDKLKAAFTRIATKLGKKFDGDVAAKGSTGATAKALPRLILAFRRGIKIKRIRPVSLKRLRLVLGKAGASPKKYRLRKVTKAEMKQLKQAGTDVDNVFGWVSRDGNGKVLTDVRGRPIIHFTDKGLSSLEQAVKTFGHEAKHIKDFAAGLKTSSEALAEVAGENLWLVVARIIKKRK